MVLILSALLCSSLVQECLGGDPSPWGPLLLATANRSPVS
jgi:hypothetical protein